VLRQLGLPDVPDVRAKFACFFEAQADFAGVWPVRAVSQLPAARTRGGLVELFSGAWLSRATLDSVSQSENHDLNEVSRPAPAYDMLRGKYGRLNMAKRQGKGDYSGGSTIISASGWGFSKPEQSLKKKQLEKRRKLKAEADAFYEQLDMQKKKKPTA
jgi:hypothetical protein